MSSFGRSERPGDKPACNQDERISDAPPKWDDPDWDAAADWDDPRYDGGPNR